MRPFQTPPASSGASSGEHPDLPELVISYMNRLRRLPVGSWAGAARKVEAAERQATSAPAPAGSLAAARATLRRIVARSPGLAVQTQRRVQNMVEIAGACLDGDEGPAMRRAALDAALALATREELGEELFATLYAPFETLIPLEDLEPVPLEPEGPWGPAPGARGLVRSA